MPVEVPDVIDFVVQHAENREVALVMVETRDWNSSPVALSQLDTKIALYATYVLTGRLNQQYPDWSKHKVVIQLDHLHPMPAAIETLLRHWAGKLAGASITVRSRRHHWRLFVRLFHKLKSAFGKPTRDVIDWPPTTALPPLLTATQFTEQLAESARLLHENCRVEIVQPFELKLTAGQGEESTLYTDNAYGLYLISPENKSDIIQKFVTSFLETQRRNQTTIDPERIVPVLKPRTWIQQVNQGLTLRGAKKPLDHVFEEYNEELIIVYAEDNPKSVRYLSTSDLEALHLEKHELRPLSCANLKRLLPSPEIENRNRTYRVMAGGDYDASLLLLEPVWNNGQVQISGELVAAIPSRDILLVVGSHDANGVKQLKLTAQTIFAQAPYALTARLFVFRDHTFVPFD